ncbi:hypothetical protein L6164_006541 [Bauhinia variegata]|uniref:Uncharacterized protein n=1 Tax=Bauhinia variegata TaxID=167791 RepID=A0ACB9PU68_BAUVA|nr:hypothetical protein L6164_006541 [Bauhinia variegata]
MAIVESHFGYVFILFSSTCHLRLDILGRDYSSWPSFLPVQSIYLSEPRAVGAFLLCSLFAKWYVFVATLARLGIDIWLKIDGSTNRTSGTSATSGPNPTPLRPTIQFSVNAWVFVVAVLAVIPIVPRNLSHRAYRLAFMGTACSSVYSLYSLYGKPRAWNLQALQAYFQSIIATKDFIYFIYCLSFVTSHLCLKFALIPILCRALEYVAKFLRRNFSSSSLYRKYLEDLCVWVESNNTTLNILTSHSEIGLGFLLIISLLSWQRNIIQTFMYWQLLKLMYHAPVTAAYHQNVCAKIGRAVNPLVRRHAPFLNTPLSAVQRWWLR